MAKASVEQQFLAWGRGETEKTHLSTDDQVHQAPPILCCGHHLWAEAGVKDESGGGPGGQLASQRRQQWSREEKRARVDREAARMATIDGREVVRRGRFWA